MINNEAVTHGAVPSSLFCVTLIETLPLQHTWPSPPITLQNSTRSLIKLFDPNLPLVMHRTVSENLEHTGMRSLFQSAEQREQKGEEISTLYELSPFSQIEMCHQ